jgi:hypothetical protein
MASSIHIKIDYGKALGLKKDTLLIEKSLLQIIQHTRNYNILRKKEFLLKSQLKKSLAEIELLVKEIEPSLPTEELKQAKLMGRQEQKEKLAHDTKKIKDKPTLRVNLPRNNIELQLQEIQEKLASLG